MIRRVLRSFRFRLLSGSLLLLALLLLTMGLFEYTVMQEYLNRTAAANLQDQIRAVGPQVWDQLAAGSPAAQFALPKLLGPDVSLVLVGKDGTLQPLRPGEDQRHSVPVLTPEQYKSLFMPGSKPDWSGIALDNQGRRETVVLLRFGPPGEAAYLIQASTFLKPTEDILRGSMAVYGLGALVTLLLGGLAFSFLIRRLLFPLSGMIQSLEGIDAGTLQDRLPSQETEELNRLARSFNSLLTRLETAFIREKEARETLRRFVADASHELRTPLTALHGFLEVLLLGAEDNPNQLHSALQSMRMESERLIKLVNELLLLARFDREPTLNKEEASLADLLKTMEPELHLLAGKRSLKVEIHGPSCLSCDKQHLKQVILNLFQNAVHYTDPLTGEIELILHPFASDLSSGKTSACAFGSGSFLVLEVRDNGSGISPQDLPHVFERFYRGEKSRNREQGGTGLGLSIVKSLVEAHGGRIRVESVTGHGTVFRVELPL
ncbi:Two component system, signal transduction histidine kinase [Acididesulfobacillus acetoxydans]|uniref:histidine kinase n=1 Tax=Acididesulfobacillus acetoxydans TaxID=1561005 RepID=A0A8S0WRL8_9FIRM|nr:HAMP domain-containing sensor histidine kinase [Acididesulfobacillus acetoxydans]CAA7603384.1 Two component system, signal transduction histidine kinase [Acididesulfobacillus acetoxydans]CEJ08317.1 Alkaline phosphatase synthesis sensor protein PhoR [Acididesulfobacillus acetoxydans]